MGISSTISRLRFLFSTRTDPLFSNQQHDVLIGRLEEGEERYKQQREVWYHQG